MKYLTIPIILLLAVNARAQNAYETDCGARPKLILKIVEAATQSEFQKHPENFTKCTAENHPVQDIPCFDLEPSVAKIEAEFGCNLESYWEAGE